MPWAAAFPGRPLRVGGSLGAGGGGEEVPVERAATAAMKRSAAAAGHGSEVEKGERWAGARASYERPQQPKEAV